jgi:hypothetical protein
MAEKKKGKKKLETKESNCEKFSGNNVLSLSLFKLIQCSFYLGKREHKKQERKVHCCGCFVDAARILLLRRL